MGDGALWAQAYKAYSGHKPTISKTKRRKYKKFNIEPQALFKPPEVEGSEAIRTRVKEINSQMKVLKAERLELKKRLKPWIIEYEKKPWILYALKLEGGFLYIGMSRNPVRRFGKHKNGKGARWTREHKPLEIIEQRITDKTLESEASKLEDDMTIEYAMKFGSQIVRGGNYCQLISPRWPDVVIQNELPA